MNKAIFALGAILLMFSAGMLMHSNMSGKLTKYTHLDEDVIKMWIEFKAKYNKQYQDVDYEVYRMQVFMSALNYINENQGDTYTLGINSMADITPEEFRANYLGLVVPENFDQTEQENVQGEGLEAPPASVNWVTQGIVPPILNQGQCGSCWAFSAAGSLSCAWNQKFQTNPAWVQLSPEQLVQCSQAYGNNGCNGGWMDNAFNYVIKNKLASNAAYPYTSGTGITGKCNTALAGAANYTMTSYTSVAKNNQVALQTAAAVRPVSVAVDASNWQYYTSGVFKNCGTSLDHGVILVGYTSSYWLVKNSWGTGWGQAGYIQLALGNTCGIEQAASYPNV